MTDTPNGSPINAQPSDQRRIRIDGTGVKNSYANTCHVASTKEEIILNFGLNESWEQGQQEMQIQLTNRIILNPHAAKRCALLLTAVMQQYEARFGALDLGIPATDASATKPAPGDTKPHVVK